MFQNILNLHPHRHIYVHVMARMLGLAISRHSPDLNLGFFSQRDWMAPLLIPLHAHSRSRLLRQARNKVSAWCVVG